MSEDRAALARSLAKGRCQCTGQCGETHNWTPQASVHPCRAPHGIEIRRKEDSPSFWQIEWGGEAMLGAGYRKQVVTVDLRPVVLPDGATLIAMCQRCKALVERVGKKGAPSVTI